MRKNQELFESGRFFIGCNYWASNAGMLMWSKWDAEVVDSDLKRLSDAGINVLRVFPLWSDFQPLKRHFGGGSVEREFRFGEEPLPMTEAGRAGVDIVMADRFEDFCDMCEKYNIKIIIGLITGWMSGRIFAPPAFEGMNLLTDPKVIRWEIRFIRYMVRRFKSHPCVAAWDLGNECNCMSGVDRDGAFVWASVVTNTVRSEDRLHPVVSGMHGLRPEGHAWTAGDQGEILDILCTHPYPMFTQYCDIDPLNTMRNIVHATAESVYFGSLGGKPCFIEEAGTLGPMISSESVAADYVRASVFSAWAHDLRGYVWWCANDQNMLDNTPYDWDAVERDLGLFRGDGTPKPVVDEFTKFTHFTDSYPVENLPERLKEAVCVLTAGQDHWAAAFGAFIMAKQAGLDIEYAWCQDEIPNSPAYLLPCLSGNHNISKHVIMNILSRVKDGATLYISINDAVIGPFEDMTGMRIQTRNKSSGNTNFTLGDDEFSIFAPFRLVLENADGCEVLAYDETGNPIFTSHKYGRGRVFFFSAPIENIVATHTGMMKDGKPTPFIQCYPFYKIYKSLGIRNPAKAASCADPLVGLTEHILADGKRIVNVLNETPAEKAVTIELAEGYRYKTHVSVGLDSTVSAAEGGFDAILPKNTGVSVFIEKM